MGTQIRKPKEMTVAMIADEFTYESFKYEFNVVTFTPSQWQEVFEKYRPQIFFCESAWQGGGNAHQQWQGKVYCSSEWPFENRRDLFNILWYCKIKHIPTVFWNKEDPTFFNNHVYNFVNTACHFDYIFTTSVECVKKYNELTKKDNAYVLPFATQPRLFNPIEVSERSKEIIFLGSWYANLKERCQEMSQMFDDILAKNYPLVIYDRNSAHTNANTRYPEKYQPYIRPGVPVSKLSALYKKSEYALNINTVTDSQTMFARRVFELISSNTFVLSNPALGVKTFFGSSVFSWDRGMDELEKLLSNQERVDEIKYDLLQDVLLNHTYEKRAEYLLDTLKIPYQKEEKLCHVVAITTTDATQELIRLWFEQQDGVSKMMTFINANQMATDDYLTFVKDYLSQQGEADEYLYLMKEPPKDSSCHYLRDLMLTYTYVEADTMVRKSPNRTLDYRYGETSDFFDCLIPLCKKDQLTASNSVPCFFTKIMSHPHQR